MLQPVPAYVTVCIRSKYETFITLRKTESIGELKIKFCERHNVKTSSVRLLLLGQHLNMEQTIDTLDLKDGDVIEAFEELLGGGPPTKRNMFGNVDKILETLDALQDTDGTTSDSSLDIEEDLDETNTVGKTDQDSNLNDEKEQSEKKAKGTRIHSG